MGMEIVLEGCELLPLIPPYVFISVGWRTLLTTHAESRSKIIGCRWEDGQPYRAVLASVDRWRVQNSHQVTVSVSDTTVKITQEVQTPCSI